MIDALLPSISCPVTCDGHGKLVIGIPVLTWHNLHEFIDDIPNNVVDEDNWFSKIDEQEESSYVLLNVFLERAV